MTKPFSLICLVGFFLFQFSLLSSAQFLPLEGEETYENMEMEIEMEIEMDMEFTNQGENQQISLLMNTPEEIGSAVSRNIASLFEAYLEMKSDILKARADSTEDALSKEINYFVSDVFRKFTGYSNIIGGIADNLVTDGLTSFQNAQANGEDVGAAVGISVAETIEDLSWGSYFIGIGLQRDINTVLSKRNLPDDYKLILKGTGGAVRRFINSISDNAETIGDLIAVAVNKAVSRDGNLANLISAVITEIFQSLADNAKIISKVLEKAVVNALKGVDGLKQKDFDRARRLVRDLPKQFQSEDFKLLIEKMEPFISSKIVEAVTIGFNGEGKAKDVVEAINRIGDFLFRIVKS